MFQPAIIGYVPRSDISPKICHPAAFIENIRKFRTRQPLILYTDGNWKADVQIPNPETVINPDVKLANGWPNQFVLNNLIFFTGLRIALRRGFSHIIYLEADCRVGCDYWDDALFDFHFRSPEPLVASGTAVAFNICTAGREAHARFTQWREAQKMIPGFVVEPPVYGWRGQSTTTEKPTVFVNGALGVYDVRFLQKVFQMDGLPPETTKDKCKALAERTFAWDFALGFELWKLFGVHSFNLIANNPAVYSGFGDVLSTPEERMELLRNGTCKAIHQIKGPETL